MASVSISNSYNNIEVTLDQSGCSGVVYSSYKLYQNGSLYTTFNTTAVYHTFQNVPPGYNYYVIVEIYVAGPTLCQSPTSNTVTVSAYCIPAGQTNMKFSDLAAFYGLNSFDIKLSGVSNPSSGDTIFGKSALPSTGNPSKTTPNAVSELRNTCGGAIDVWGTPPPTYSYFRYTGQLAENLKAGFYKDGLNNVSNYVLAPATPPGSFSYCASFANEQRNYIMQSNGTIGVETIGPKVVKVNFTTSSLQLAMTGTITVKRLSDNATLATATVNASPGTNMWNNPYTLSWTNSANDTKIAVIVDVYQNCVV